MDAAVLDGLTPAALQTHRLAMAISSAKGIPVANTPEVSAQETVLARARVNQHTTSHMHPIQAPSAVLTVGETTTATRTTSSANQDLTWLIVGWLGCLGAGCCWDCGGCVGWGAH